MNPLDQTSSAEALLASLSGATTAVVDSIETVRSSVQPNVLHVLVTDSDGVTGLGETFYGASSVEAHIHDVIVPTLAAERPVALPSELSRVLQGYVGYAGSGAEVRARSALDIALWDIAGKRSGTPLKDLLAPGSPSSIPTYNTCSGMNYVNAQSRQSSSNWGISFDAKPPGDYEDLWAFLNEPAKLARALVEAGYQGMKVWPFDLAAEHSRGQSGGDLSFGLSVLEAIRSEVGSAIDLYVELHSLWEPEAARSLIAELEPFSLTWVEDPIRADRIPELASLRSAATMPLAVGENLGSGFNGYRSMIAEKAVDVAILDLGWGGGVTEALSTMALTRDNGVGIAFHDCTGPVSLAVATHCALASDNCSVQEVARAFWHGWYPAMATGYPDISGGVATVSNAPGHGAQLTPDFLDSSTSHRRVSRVGAE